MLKTFSITDIGKRRKLNQDYVYTSERPVGNLPNVFIVADGMGGHNAGDYASKYTVETIVKEIAASFEVNPEKILAHAIEVANEGVIKLASENADMEGMGTTVVAATCMGKYLRVANVGDSRLYVVGEKITQITRDHSLVEEMVRMGGIDRATARNHPDKNIITRAIGASEKVEVAGFSGRRTISEKPEYAVEFIGYFPADEPKYSIIVSMNKIGLPASGGLMAGSVFSGIVNHMTK